MKSHKRKRVEGALQRRIKDLQAWETLAAGGQAKLPDEKSRDFTTKAKIAHRDIEAMKEALA